MEEEGERGKREFQERKLRNNGSVIEGKPGSYSIKDANIKACFKDRVVTSVKCYCGYIR